MSPIQALMRAVDWQPVDNAEASTDGLPHVTHSGVIDLAGISLRCYRLNTGESIIDADDMGELFGELDE